MTNIRNHLSADPTAKIVVVAHGRGIEFLLKEAETPGGRPFVTDIDALALRGVESACAASPWSDATSRPRESCPT